MKQELTAIVPVAYCYGYHDRTLIVDRYMRDARASDDLHEVRPITALLMGEALYRSRTLGLLILEGVAAHMEKSNLAA